MVRQRAVKACHACQIPSGSFSRKADQVSRCRNQIIITGPVQRRDREENESSFLEEKRQLARGDSTNDSQMKNKRDLACYAHGDVTRRDACSCRDRLLLDP